jgi:hypothetical protein
MRPVALGRKNWSTSAAHKRDRRLQQFSRSWKAAVGFKSRCAIAFPRFSPGLPISPQVPSRPYSRCGGRPAFIDSSDRGATLTLSVGFTVSGYPSKVWSAS